jgi:hypothetical protein
VIYLAIILLWGCYLVPAWLGRHGSVPERSLDRAVNRYSHAVRVLARRPRRGQSPLRALPPPRRPTFPASARRRRTLLTASTALPISAGLSTAGFIPQWTIGVCMIPPLAFMFAVRRQLRSRGRRRKARAAQFINRHDGDNLESPQGLWRSPVAHLVRIEGVRGSNPLSSTEEQGPPLHEREVGPVRHFAG